MQMRATLKNNFERIICFQSVTGAVDPINTEAPGRWISGLVWDTVVSSTLARCTVGNVCEMKKGKGGRHTRITRGSRACLFGARPGMLGYDIRHLIATNQGDIYLRIFKFGLLARLRCQFGGTTWGRLKVSPLMPQANRV